MKKIWSEKATFLDGSNIDLGETGIKISMLSFSPRFLSGVVACFSYIVSVNFNTLTVLFNVIWIIRHFICLTVLDLCTFMASSCLSLSVLNLDNVLAMYADSVQACI